MIPSPATPEPAASASPTREPLHPTVRALGTVSLLTDASSEMIYPLLPGFLTATLGAGAAAVGLIEGAAEAVAAAAKVLSGRASDRSGRRKPLVVAGYALSSLVRPLIALASAPAHVLAVRVADRLGKGIRGAPRDALLAQVTRPGDRGRAFGFQRAMDHTGAVIGPLLASLALWWTGSIRLVFALAAVPAALAVAALVLRVQEAVPRPAPGGPRPAPGALGRVDDAAAAAAPLESGFVRYLVVLFVFTLGNSSDAFLLLRAQEAGVTLALVPALWSLHHVVKAALGTWGGAVSDRIGRRRTIVIGWAVYALVYLGFALAAGPLAVVALFVLYGLFHALTEGAERALVAQLAGETSRGRAFGLFHAVTGLALLPASLLTGMLWQRFGAGVALATGAALAALASAALLLAVPEPEPAGSAVR